MSQSKNLHRLYPQNAFEKEAFFSGKLNALTWGYWKRKLAFVSEKFPKTPLGALAASRRRFELANPHFITGEAHDETGVVVHDIFRVSKSVYEDFMRDLIDRVTKKKETFSNALESKIDILFQELPVTEGSEFSLDGFTGQTITPRTVKEILTSYLQGMDGLNDEDKMKRLVNFQGRNIMLEIIFEMIFAQKDIKRNVEAIARLYNERLEKTISVPSDVIPHKLYGVDITEKDNEPRYSFHDIKEIETYLIKKYPNLRALAEDAGITLFALCTASYATQGAELVFGSGLVPPAEGIIPPITHIANMIMSGQIGPGPIAFATLTTATAYTAKLLSSYKDLIYLNNGKYAPSNVLKNPVSFGKTMGLVLLGLGLVILAEIGISGEGVGSGAIAKSTNLSDAARACAGVPKGYEQDQRVRKGDIDWATTGAVAGIVINPFDSTKRQFLQVPARMVFKEDAREKEALERYAEGLLALTQRDKHTDGICRSVDIATEANFGLIDSVFSAGRIATDFLIEDISGDRGPQKKGFASSSDRKFRVLQYVGVDSTVLEKEYREYLTAIQGVSPAEKSRITQEYFEKRVDLLFQSPIFNPEVYIKQGKLFESFGQHLLELAKSIEDKGIETEKISQLKESGAQYLAKGKTLLNQANVVAQARTQKAQYIKDALRTQNTDDKPNNDYQPNLKPMSGQEIRGLGFRQDMPEVRMIEEIEQHYRQTETLLARFREIGKRYLDASKQGPAPDRKEYAATTSNFNREIDTFIASFNRVQANGVTNANALLRLMDFLDDKGAQEQGNLEKWKGQKSPVAQIKPNQADLHLSGRIQHTPRFDHNAVMYAMKSTADKVSAYYHGERKGDAPSALMLNLVAWSMLGTLAFQLGDIGTIMGLRRRKLNNQAHLPQILSARTADYYGQGGMVDQLQGHVASIRFHLRELTSARVEEKNLVTGVEQMLREIERNYDFRRKGNRFDLYPLESQVLQNTYPLYPHIPNSDERVIRVNPAQSEETFKKYQSGGSEQFKEGDIWFFNSIDSSRIHVVEKRQNKNGSSEIYLHRFLSVEEAEEYMNGEHSEYLLMNFDHAQTLTPPKKGKVKKYFFRKDALNEANAMIIGKDGVVLYRPVIEKDGSAKLVEGNPLTF